MGRAKAVGPFVQQFIVEGQWLGEAPRGMEVIHDRPQMPSSIAFTCPHCAEIWARCPVSLPGGKPNWFQIISHACRKCQTDGSCRQGVHGSIICSWLPEFVEAFPEAVWKRELLRHLSLYPES